MQSFTKIEIGWISAILRKTGREIQDAIGDDDGAAWMTPMWHLRAEQYLSLAERLDRAICEGDKRIAITY